MLFFFPVASSPICTAQACHFRDLSDEFARVGAQRVGVSTDTVDKQAHFAQQRSFDYPLLSDADGVVSELFGVRRGRLAKLRRSVVAREPARRGRHTRRRGLLARLLPVRRTTFVIDTDRTILKVVSSEVRASAHADQTLWFLENHDVRIVRHMSVRSTPTRISSRGATANRSATGSQNRKPRTSRAWSGHTRRRQAVPTLVSNWHSRLRSKRSTPQRSRRAGGEMMCGVRS